jgi:gas vesicle protein
MTERGSEAPDIMLSFLLGGVVGAAVALLYAPRAGNETRERLRTSVQRGAERGRELKERMVGRGRDLLDNASSAVERGRERVSAAMEAGRDAYHEERESMVGAPGSTGRG